MRERVVFFIAAMLAVSFLTAITIGQAIERVGQVERETSAAAGR